MYVVIEDEGKVHVNELKEAIILFTPTMCSGAGYEMQRVSMLNFDVGFM